MHDCYAHQLPFSLHTLAQLPYTPHLTWHLSSGKSIDHIWHDICQIRRRKNDISFMSIRLGRPEIAILFSNTAEDLSFAWGLASGVISIIEKLLMEISILVKLQNGTFVVSNRLKMLQGSGWIYFALGLHCVKSISKLLLAYVCYGMIWYNSTVNCKKWIKVVFWPMPYFDNCKSWMSRIQGGMGWPSNFNFPRLWIQRRPDCGQAWLGLMLRDHVGEWKDGLIAASFPHNAEKVPFSGV